MIKGEFVDTEFLTRYQRNNKKHSLKNLRCFPSCGEEHREKGYCGRSVSFRVTVNLPTKIYCFAEFINFEQDSGKGCTPPEVPPLSVEIGTQLTLESALKRCRSKERPGHPWLHGKDTIRSAESIFYEFNQERRGWHYGWQSNKHTCDTLHCFRVYIFITSYDNIHIICNNIVDSRKFMLFCRRRRRFYATSTELSKRQKLNISSIDEYDKLFKDIIHHLYINHVVPYNFSNTVSNNEKDMLLSDVSGFIFKQTSFQTQMKTCLGFNYCSIYYNCWLKCNSDNTAYFSLLNLFQKLVEEYRTKKTKLSLTQFHNILNIPTTQYKEQYAFENVARRVATNINLSVRPTTNSLFENVDSLLNSSFTKETKQQLDLAKVDSFLNSYSFNE